jgi:hypothetical protein
MMPRRKVAEPEPAAPRCEVCGEEAPNLSARHGGFGLRCCFECVRLPSSEVAVRWMRKIRRVIER